MAEIETTESSDTIYAGGVVLVLLAGGCWSIAGLAMRLIDEVDEWRILFYRSLALMLTLLTYIAIKNRGAVAAAFRSAGRPALWGGTCLGTAFASWIFAMTHTTIANALFILSASTFVTAVMARLFLGENVRRVTLVCMAISMFGIIIMVAGSVFDGTLLGSVFAAGAVFGFSAFTVVLRSSRTVDMAPAVCWAGLWGALLGAAIMAVMRVDFAITPHDFGLCALMGVVQVGLGLILFTIGSRRLPAAELTLLSLTEVILGPVWVWLGVGEVPGGYTLLGGAIVLTAVVMQALSGIRRRRPPLGVV